MKNDFRGMFSAEQYPLGCGSKDTLPNMISCSVLKHHFKSEELVTNKISYEDIYSNDIIKQKEVTELNVKLVNIRNNIMNNIPVDAQTTGPCINLQRPSILSN